MAVRFEQLMKGGRAYLRENAARPGAPADVRLKPVKVHSVERGAAYVEVLDTGNRFVTKFSNLEPDLDYLKAQLEKVNARRVPPSNDTTPCPRPPATVAPASVWPEDELEPEPRKPSWPPRLGEVATVQVEPPKPVKAEPAPAPVLEPTPGERWLEDLVKLEATTQETEVATPPAEETDQDMTNEAKTRRQIASQQNAKRPRRNFTPEQIAEGVQDILSGMTRKAVCEKWGIYSVTYGGWKKRAAAEVARQKASERARERARSKQAGGHSADLHLVVNGTDRQVLEPAQAEERPVQAQRLEQDNERLKGVVKMLLEKRPYTLPDMEAQGRALMKAIGALLEVGT